MNIGDKYSNLHLQPSWRDMETATTGPHLNTFQQPGPKVLATFNMFACSCLLHPAGTSFIFSRDQPLCKVLHFDVGILTPDWLANSTNLGQMETDTFVCDVWTKAGWRLAPSGLHAALHLVMVVSCSVT
jgi:hypothetical protein